MNTFPRDSGETDLIGRKGVIREYDSTLYVGMVQGVSNSQYIGIGTKSRKASKTAKTRLHKAKYEIFIH